MVYIRRTLILHISINTENSKKVKLSFPLLGLELRFLGRLARSQSLYRLRYPASNTENSSIPLTDIAANSFAKAEKCGIVKNI
jgi:hypothetical protein